MVVVAVAAAAAAAADAERLGFFTSFTPTRLHGPISEIIFVNFSYKVFTVSNVTMGKLVQFGAVDMLSFELFDSSTLTLDSVTLVLLVLPLLSTLPLLLIGSALLLFKEVASVIAASVFALHLPVNVFSMIPVTIDSSVRSGSLAVSKCTLNNCTTSEMLFSGNSLTISSSQTNGIVGRDATTDARYDDDDDDDVEADIISYAFPNTIKVYNTF